MPHKLQVILGRRRGAKGAIWVFPLQTDVSLGNTDLVLDPRAFRDLRG